MLAAHDSTASYNNQVMRNIDEALLNRDPKTSELVRELATKWEQTNPTTWRFTLRQGVKFHDGSPFNAEAAAEALNFNWDKANAFRVRGYVGPEFTFKPVSEYVLDVVLESPDPILPSRLYFAPLHSPKAQREAPDQSPLKPVGDRPLQVRGVGQGPAHQARGQPGLVGPHRLRCRRRRHHQGHDLLVPGGA